MDVEQAPGIVRHKPGGQDAHEARQHHQIGRVAVDFGHQGRIKRFAASKGLVVQHMRRDAVVLGKSQALGIGPVAQHGGHSGVQELAPAALLCRTHDGGHVGARARNQNDDVFHEGQDYPC